MAYATGFPEVLLMLNELMILCVRFGAESEWQDLERMVFSVTYPTPYGLFSPIGIATESSVMRLLLSPSIHGSIRRLKTCWWKGAITPSLTIVPHGTEAPLSIGAVDRMPVAWIL